ncbi:transcription initiation factor TFIID subunit 4-like isoform X2 [Leptidea sinapis]|uniref:transcription initiation factor TFIID subunit 4-like isoform X2 n=1 Tax=Leptidea sinapis TaxID=189913 RepID=UPI0021C45612|nr:transcription initiation factor TFIID subunit 4-like isoform X2 [Leptidea sinapis]
MASAEFLEQALSSDVDESAVIAKVGSLENQLLSSILPVSVPKKFTNVIPNNISNILCSESSNIGHKLSDCESVGTNIQSTLTSASFSAPLSNYSPSNVTSNSDFINTESSQFFKEDRNISKNILKSTLNFHTVQGGSESIKPITIQPVVLKQATIAGQVNMHPAIVIVPLTESSGMASNMQNVTTINKPVQNVTSHNMGSAPSPVVPNVQIIITRPPTPMGGTQSVPTVSPRVVIGTPQMLGARAAMPGITLQSLQQGQQSHLLLRTENGQYHLLRIGSAPVAGTLTAPQAQTLRFSTVPAPGVVSVSTGVAIPGQMSAGPRVATPVAMQTAPVVVQQQPVILNQKPPDNSKEKCRNFLANILDVLAKEPKSVEQGVRNLIQELIDAHVEPEEFCDRLEKLLKASPQPCLIGFLRKSLPPLRQSMCTGELVLEGINPPPLEVAFSSIPSPTAPSQPQPVVLGANIQMLEYEGSPPTLTTLQPPFQFVQPPNPYNVVQVQPTLLQPKAPPKSGSSVSILQNIPVHTKINSPKVGKTMTASGKANVAKTGGSSAVLSTILTARKPAQKDKEKKSALQFTQPFGDDKMAGDDDINDVAAMGGVNLAEESQRILGSTEMIGTQIRSCKDEYLLSIAAFINRMKLITQRHGLEDLSPEVSALISHATSGYLKGIITQLISTKYRGDSINKQWDPDYEVTQDVRGQLKFLEEVGRVARKRQENLEREVLMKAAKSRSKNDNPEQAKLKAKGKEMQRAEYEELRQREANQTALQAIGPRKKARVDGAGCSKDTTPQCTAVNEREMAQRPRMTRVNLRDMIFFLEQKKDPGHQMLT